MKTHGVKRIWTNPFFCMKKHFCPNCNRQLQKVKSSRIINSKSAEASRFDFSGADGWIRGNIKFVWTEFYCEDCRKCYSINELKTLISQE